MKRITFEYDEKIRSARTIATIVQNSSAVVILDPEPNKTTLEAIAEDKANKVTTVKNSKELLKKLKI